MDTINRFKLKLPYLEKIMSDFKDIGYNDVGKVYLYDDEIGLCHIVGKTMKKGKERTHYLFADILLTKSVTEELFVYYKGYHSENGLFMFEGLLFKETSTSNSTKQIKDLLTYS